MIIGSCTFDLFVLHINNFRVFCTKYILFICSSSVLIGKVFVYKLNVANRANSFYAIMTIKIWNFLSFRFTGQSPRGHVERPLGSVLHYDVWDRRPHLQCGNILAVYHTPARTYFISGLKSRVLKFTFLAENDGEKRPRIIYLEIHWTPSELLLHSAKKSAYLACQVSRYLWRGSVNSKKNPDHFSPSFLKT